MSVQTEWIVTTKAEVAQKKVNAFLESLDKKGMKLVAVKPLIAFSGPSLMIGAMIEYKTKIDYYSVLEHLKEENDGFDNTEVQC